MRLVVLLTLLGSMVWGQETQMKKDTAAAERFQKDLAAGKEFQILKLRPVVKLEPNELRCGDYFVRGSSISKNAGQKVATLIYWIDVHGDFSSMEIKRDDHIVRIDNTKKFPKFAIRPSKDGGISKVVLKISAKDFANAEPCLPSPEQAQLTKK